MIDRKLKKDLLAKKGFTHQRLSQIIKEFKKENLISTTENATYLYAHQSGLDLSEYLNSAEIDKLRILNSELKTPTSNLSSVEIKSKASKSKKVTSIRKPKDLIVNDPLLHPRKIKEANNMAELYPYLYILENSIRELIDIVLTKKYGDDWWEKKASSSTKEAMEKNRKNERKHPWHQKRGARNIDYLDLIDLKGIIKKNENDFIPEIFGDFDWINGLVKEVYQSRCVFAHMNPLEDTNFNAVILRFKQWQKLINEKKDAIIRDN